MNQPKDNLKNPSLIGGSMLHKRVNPDLQEERDKCVFDQKEMITKLWDPFMLKTI